MSTPADSEGSKYNIPSFDHHEGDGLQNIGKLLGDIGTIAERLPVFAHASRQETELEYFARSEKEYAYPQALKDWTITRDISSIAITISSEDGNTPTSTIELITNDDDRMHISRDPKAPSQTAMDVVIEDGYANYIPRISDDEINALLLSIAAKDTEVPDLPPIGHRLEPSDLFDRLSANAISTDTTYIFEFENSDLESIYYKMSRFGAYDRLTDVYIRYKTGSSRIMSVSIDRLSGLSITFEVSDPEHGISQHYPDEGDYVRLQEIITGECARMLDEHSFDTPDPSA